MIPEALVGEFIDAAVQDRERAVSLLMSHPDLINARWMHQETVLHFLAIEGFADSVEFLAQRGADLNLVNEFGDTALIDVVALGYEDVTGVLLRHGADPNAGSATRDNALHCAVRAGNDRIVAQLLAAGADARYRTDLGESIFDALPASGPEREKTLAVLAEYGIVQPES